MWLRPSRNFRINLLVFANRFFAVFAIIMLLFKWLFVESERASNRCCDSALNMQVIPTVNLEIRYRPSRSFILYFKDFRIDLAELFELSYRDKPCGNNWIWNLNETGLISVWSFVTPNDNYVMLTLDIDTCSCRCTCVTLINANKLSEGVSEANFSNCDILNWSDGRSCSNRKSFYSCFRQTQIKIEISVRFTQSFLIERIIDEKVPFWRDEIN